MRPLLAHCHLGFGILFRRHTRLDQTRNNLSTAIKLYRAMAMTCWLTQAEAELARVVEAAPADP
jgi:hypothetical protein